MTPESNTPSVPHDDKGFSEEKCIRCGWVMGSPALNCQNDDTPHVFPSQGGEREFIAQELTRVQQAGNGLAEAAQHVSAHFDGVHRLRLALAGWYTALANEGGRGQ